MVEFRWYQQKSIDLVRDKWKAGLRKIVVCLATGGGKTYIFAGIGKRIHEKRKGFMVLVDRKELLRQAVKSIMMLDVVPGVITAANSKSGRLNKHGLEEAMDIASELDRAKGTGTKYQSAVMRQIRAGKPYCFVSMQETLWRRVNKFETFLDNIGGIDLIVMDEVHGGHFKRLVELFKDKFILGFSATPKSSSTKEPLKTYFDDIVCAVQIEDLINEGFLNPCKTYGVKIDLKGLRFNKLTREFDEDSQTEVFGREASVNSIIKNYQEIAGGSKAICFCAGIQHSIQMHLAFSMAGIPSWHLDGTTPPDEREEILQEFAKCKGGVLCNAKVVTTGFDEPSVETIILAKKVCSVVEYFQMCGRGSRLHPGKDHFKILDFGGNWQQHGLWSDPYDWVDEFYNPRKEDPEAEAPVKLCAKCEAVSPIGATKCKECGTPFPVKLDTVSSKKEKEKVEVTLKEIKEAERKKKIDSMPEHLKGRKFYEMTTEELCEYAKHMGYKPGWVYYMTKNRSSDFAAALRGPDGRSARLPVADKEPVNSIINRSFNGLGDIDE